MPTINGHEMAREVEHCKLADLAEITITGNDADGAEFVAIVDEYLSHFCKPVTKDGAQRCPKCGKAFNGLMAMVGMPDVVAIEWGLVHGEARCTGCKWPYRGVHRIKGKDHKDGDEPILRISNMFLAYHPDEVTVRSTTDKIREALRG